MDEKVYPPQGYPPQPPQDIPKQQYPQQTPCNPPPYNMSDFSNQNPQLIHQNQLIAPPQYFIGGAVQQDGTQVVVVQQQPAIMVTTAVQPTSGDYYLTMSIIVTFMCFMCFGVSSLLCTIPAIMISLSAKDDAAIGNIASAQQKGCVSLALNIVAIIVGIVLTLVVIGAIIGSFGSATSYCAYSYSSYC